MFRPFGAHAPRRPAVHSSSALQCATPLCGQASRYRSLRLTATALLPVFRSSLLNFLPKLQQIAVIVVNGKFPHSPWKSFDVVANAGFVFKFGPHRFDVIGREV